MSPASKIASTRPAFSGLHTMTLRIGRRAYAEMFGPTTGDRVRLADTELLIESNATTPPTAKK
jgi:hypothetical protein